MIQYESDLNAFGQFTEKRTDSKKKMKSRMIGIAGSLQKWLPTAVCIHTVCVCVYIHTDILYINYIFIIYIYFFLFIIVYICSI